MAMKNSTSNKLDERECRLIEGYNKLEEMLKLSQLVMYVFEKSALNEIRYFARAYVDVRGATNEKDRQRAYGRAEAALSAAFTDVLDALVDHIKVMVRKFRDDFIFADVWLHLDEMGYLETVDALEKADYMILRTRGERNGRFDAYVQFSQTKEYENIIKFAFSLQELERRCELDKGRSNRKIELERLRWVREALNNATRNKEKCMFELYVQPKCAVDTPNTIVGVEALLRLKRPDLDLPLSPDAFLNVALKANQGHNIAVWVLNEAVKIIKDWQKNYTLPDQFDFAINLSPSLAGDEDFNKTFCNKVRGKKLSGHISIEITEDWVVEANEHRDISHCVKSLPGGTRIAIDDFGTGTTKIEYIALIDGLTSLKIDKTFIDGLLTKNKKSAETLIKGIVALADKTNLKVIAEGVEEKEQADILSALGVDQMQGYYFQRPIPASDFLDQYLKNENLFCSQHRS